jgi:uncharacterized repeat protein (TIGR04076 family)
MFQVKATVTDFLGDEDKYPCHFQYKIGDEFIYDGGKFIGGICPVFIPIVMPKIHELHAAGPRFKEVWSYYPTWFAPVSVKDPSLKKYDGRGFRNVFQTYVEPQYHMARLFPQDGHKWPPHQERVAQQPMAICPDYRTSVVLKMEAFDISGGGFDAPFFRRQMSILNKVIEKPGIQLDKILNEFTKEQIEGIYPALSQMMIWALSEELELVGHIEMKDGKVSPTSKGKEKMEAYKSTLTAEEKEALLLK